MSCSQYVRYKKLVKQLITAEKWRVYNIGTNLTK